MLNTFSLSLTSTDPTVQSANGTNSQAITSTAFTVEFWTNITNYAPATGATDPRFVQISDASNNLQIVRDLTTTRIVTKHTQTDATTTGHKWGAADLSTATWYHIAVTVDNTGTVTHVYLAASTDSSHTDLTDGGTLNVSVGTGSPAASTIYLGARADNVAYLNGLLDEVRVWSGTRTAAQIDANWKTVLSSGPVAYYKLDNNYTDSGSGGNNLSGVNTPTFSTNVPFPGTPGGGLFGFFEV